jgi:hypothetical protein
MNFDTTFLSDTIVTNIIKRLVPISANCRVIIIVWLHKKYFRTGLTLSTTNIAGLITVDTS